MFIGNTLHTVGQMLVFMEVGAGAVLVWLGRRRGPMGGLGALAGSTHGEYRRNRIAPRACASQRGSALAHGLHYQGSSSST